MLDHVVSKGRILFAAIAAVALTGCPVAGTSQTTTPDPLPGVYFKLHGAATSPGQATSTNDGGLFLSGVAYTEYGDYPPSGTLWAVRYSETGIQAWATVVDSVYSGPKVGPYDQISNVHKGGYRYQAYGTPTDDGGGAVLGFTGTFDVRGQTGRKVRPILAKIDADGVVEWRSKFGSREDRLGGAFNREPDTIVCVMNGKLGTVPETHGIYFVEHSFSGDINAIYPARGVPTDRFPGGGPVNLWPNVILPTVDGGWIIGSVDEIVEIDAYGFVLRETTLQRDGLEEGNSQFHTFDLEPLDDGTFMWGLTYINGDRENSDLKSALHLIHLDNDWEPISYQRVPYTPPSSLLPAYARDIAVSNGNPVGVLLNRHSVSRYVPTIFGRINTSLYEVVWIPFDHSLTIRPDLESPFIRRTQDEEFIQSSVTLSNGRAIGIATGVTHDSSDSAFNGATHLFGITPEGAIGEPF